MRSVPMVDYPPFWDLLLNKTLTTMPNDQFPDVPLSEHMSTGQMGTLVLLERTGGIISLIAVMFIFVAFGLAPEVRNVQNTFIVFASVSNVGASVASIIAMDGLMRGRYSPLCQAQGFMFQMFMQSDPWWSLAMSINVFLVFFFRTSPDLFQKRWWVYCVICYGGPFVIALSLLLQRDAGRGPVYGEATIWCWVDREWDEVRIFTYYMLIWVCIFGSLILYFLVGYQVFRARDELRSFSTAKSRDDVVHMSAGESGLQDPRLVLLPNVPQDGFYGTVITEVQVIHSAASSSTLPSEPKRVHIMSSATEVSFDEFERTKCDRECQGTSPSNQYYSTVTSSRSSRRKAPPTIWGRITAGLRTLLNKFVVEDPIKAAYLRTSLLFAISVLVTWIPSSMNRIHSWIAGQSPFEYHVATAAVLPLQGLWNAVIFFVTSYEVLKRRLMHLWSSGQAGDSSAAAGPNKGGATPGRRSTNRRLDGLETSDDEDDEAIIADEGIFADVQIDDSAIELRRVSQSLKKGTCRG